MKIINIFLCLFLFASQLSHAEIQTLPLNITPLLIKKIKHIKADTSNADEVEQLIGKPAACLPLLPLNESWMCQWKGNVKSSRIENTLNIMFTAGMITNLVVIDANGNKILK